MPLGREERRETASRSCYRPDEEPSQRSGRPDGVPGRSIRREGLAGNLPDDRLLDGDHPETRRDNDFHDDGRKADRERGEVTALLESRVRKKPGTADRLLERTLDAAPEERRRLLERGGRQDPERGRARRVAPRRYESNLGQPEAALASAGRTNHATRRRDSDDAAHPPPVASWRGRLADVDRQRGRRLLPG